MGLRSWKPEMDEVEKRKARLVKLQKYFKIITPLFFLPLVIFIAGVVAGGITGKNNAIRFGLQGVGIAVVGVVSHFYINRDLKRQGNLPSDVFRDRIEIWKPVKIPVLAGSLLIIAIEIFIIFSFPGIEGLITAITTASAISIVLFLYIKRVTRLPWKELLFGKKN